MSEINFIYKTNGKVKKTWNGLRGTFFRICLNLGTVHLQRRIFADKKIIGNRKSTASPDAETQNTLQIPMPQDPIFWVSHRRLQCATEHRKTLTQMLKRTPICWFLHGVYNKPSHNYRTPITFPARSASHSDIVNSHPNQGLAETCCFSLWNC